VRIVNGLASKAIASETNKSEIRTPQKVHASPRPRPFRDVNRGASGGNIVVFFRLISATCQRPRHSLRRTTLHLFRWFVGLGIDDAVWDHSTFSKNRERLLAADVAAKFLAANSRTRMPAGRPSSCSPTDDIPDLLTPRAHRAHFRSGVRSSSRRQNHLSGAKFRCVLPRENGPPCPKGRRAPGSEPSRQEPNAAPRISVPAGGECSLNRREELAPPSCGAFLTES